MSSAFVHSRQASSNFVKLRQAPEKGGRMEVNKTKHFSHCLLNVVIFFFVPTYMKVMFASLPLLFYCRNLYWVNVVNLGRCETLFGNLGIY